MEWLQKAKRGAFNLLLFPLMALMLTTLIFIDNQHLFAGSEESVIYTYLNSFADGEIGSGYGPVSTDYTPRLNLEPGDIVLGGWPHCAYGRFSHAGIYVGNNKVLEGYVDYGLSVQDLSHYLEYNELCLLRVQASPDVKEKAVAYALGHQGQMFYPAAFKQGDRFWNCTKIIWEAYKLQGIELDPINDLWMAPQSLCASPNVKIIYEKGI